MFALIVLQILDSVLEPLLLQFACFISCCCLIFICFALGVPEILEMAEPKGTENDNICGDWYLVTEAECIEDTLEELFDESTNESNVSNLINDCDEVDEGNPLALYNEQISEVCENSIQALKRKFIVSPQKSDADLSPRLAAVHITPEKTPKRRLFNDSGVGEDEVESSNVQVASEDSLNSNVAGENGGSSEVLAVLHSSNRRATLLSKFKERYNVSFTELTRSFKSDKTCNNNWIVFAIGIVEELIEACKTILQQHCVYFQIIMSDFAGLFVLEFKAAKSRETLIKLLSRLLNAKEEQLLCEPPKNRSTVAALYFYKKALTNSCFKYGPFPQWISQLTIIEHQAATAESFKLAEMIQWAYDNDILEETAIAYNYALYASENANAAAFLQSNYQVKYVKDCSSMVKMYKKQEMKNMTMSEWINKCCGNVKEGDDWKQILRFLKFQGINILEFLIALKLFFKCVPKKMCIVIWGPPDTGKSYFLFYLLKFLKGKTVSYMNKASHFWLMPLSECKVGLLDDATYNCWTFLDVHMRNAFDGNTVCIDIKHKNMQQMTLPPMFISTNVDVKAEQSLMYLHSRLTCFNFPNKLPLDTHGNPLFTFTDKSWASFFRKFWQHLELSTEDADGDPGESERSFCCTARSSVELN